MLPSLLVFAELLWGRLVRERQLYLNESVCRAFSAALPKQVSPGDVVLHNFSSWLAAL